jgi:hypothetical protein
MGIGVDHDALGAHVLCRAVDQPGRLPCEVLRTRPVALFHGDEGDQDLVELCLLGACGRLAGERRYGRLAGHGERERSA